MKHDEASTTVRFQIAANIRVLREERRHSQSRFAEMISMNRSYFNQIEQGRENVTIDQLVKIADGLDVPVAALFEGLEYDAPRNLTPSSPSPDSRPGVRLGRKEGGRE